MAATVHAPDAQGGTATPLQAAAGAVHTCAQTDQAGGSTRSPLAITFTVGREGLPHFTDAYIAQLWHIAQANPAPFGDRDACNFATTDGRAIVTR